MKFPFKRTTTQKVEKKSEVFNYDKSDAAWVELLDSRIEKSKGYWESKYKLEKRSKENEKLYYGTNVLDKEDEETELSLDNRIFSSVRTIVPYVTSRITEPEVYPSSNAEAARRFAEDFEKALYIHASNEKLKPKVKFALEDAIIRRRGYLKPRYDAVNHNFCAIEYVPAESIIIDHKAKPYEEPRYFRHILDSTIADLLTMFPEMAGEIRQEFGVDENTPRSALDAPYKINEDWCFVPGGEGLDLIVTWSYNKICLGKMQDPNWRYGKLNFLPHHMMPLVCLNVLNDGRSLIDKTSFIEQAKLLQENVDKRSTQISKNAGLGNTGMPVVDSSALADDQSEYLSFNEDIVLELDVSNTNGRSINDVFTTWQAAPMPNFVYEDKLDSRQAIDNVFGTPDVFRGMQSDNKTLGQDVLLRDQATGRQQEIVDAIDNAMERLYQLMAQFLLVYGDEQEMFRFVGENREFDYVLLNTSQLDTDVMIRVKSGTSMPIDRPQRRAVAQDAGKIGFIDPLSYWEIMDEPNAQKYAKRVMDYKADPVGFLHDTQDELFNRDAFIDIELLKNGAQPPFRDDLPKEYFDYLNKYVLSGDLDNPTIAPEIKDTIMQFVDAQLARGQKMLGMAETQLPTPQDVQAANQQIDEANSAPQPPAQGAPPAPAAKAAPNQVQ